MSGVSATVVAIATRYLGPAAGVFLDRQAKSHLGAPSLSELTPDQWPVFLYWVGLSSNLLINEKSQALVGELSRALRVAPATSPRG